MIILPSGQRNGTTISPEFSTPEFCGAIFAVDSTVQAGGGLTFFLEFLDEASMKWLTYVQASATIAGPGTRRIVVSPTATNINTEEQHQAPLPERWRVKIVHTDGTNITYSVGASMIRRA